MSDFSKLKSRKLIPRHTPLCKYKTTDFFGFHSTYNNELVHVSAGEAVRFIEYSPDREQIHISYKGMHLFIPKELVSYEIVPDESDSIEFKSFNSYVFDEYVEAGSADGHKVLIEPGEKAIFIQYEGDKTTCLVMYMLEQIVVPTFVLSEVKEV